MGLNCRSSATGGSQEPTGREGFSALVSRIEDQAGSESARLRAGLEFLTFVHPGVASYARRFFYHVRQNGGSCGPNPFVLAQRF